MRSNEVFARMSPEATLVFLDELTEADRAAATAVLGSVAEAFKLRPKFLRSQPRAKQAEWMRKVLGRAAAADAAEEILAAYFLSEAHLGLLTELLDALGLEHDEGQLAEANPKCPEKKELERAIQQFREGDAPERRQVLLEAFAAQSAVDWPALEALL